MMTMRGRAILASLIGLVLLGAGAINSQLPELGAGGLLHPARRPVTLGPPASCQNTTFTGVGVTLQGWTCRTSTARVGTLVYLHGIADNRTSSVGVIERFGRRGFDVVAYDSRAHGASSGNACTYGYFEKQDLRRVLDDVDGPIVLLGTSLGAAVALQAADDPRVSAVVAAETFSDLRTVASERAPFVFTSGTIARALQLAEREGRFEVDAVSPLRAAAHIIAPVLLIHGDADVDTPPDHSRRVFAALRGSKRLILVPGAGHNGSLRPSEVWEEIDAWLDGVLVR
jgi:uncharacterized protein